MSTEETKMVSRRRELSWQWIVGSNLLLLLLPYSLYCGAVTVLSDALLPHLKGILWGTVSVALLTVAISSLARPAFAKQVLIAAICLLYFIFFIATAASRTSISVREMLYALRSTPADDLARLAEFFVPNWLYVVVLGCFVLSLYVSRVNKSPSACGKAPLSLGVLALVCYCLLIAVNVSNKEPLAATVSAALIHPLDALANKHGASSMSHDANSTDQPIGGRNSSNETPNIFIVLMESFNPRFVGQRGPGGLPVTPELDRLKGESAWVESFFANGVFSLAGQIAILASVYPSFTLGSAEVYEGVGRPTLPKILKENGYKTVFYTAHDTLAYNPPSVFRDWLGFDKVVAMDGSTTSNLVETEFWGWGLQDDRFYSVCLNQLEQQTDGRPVFAVLANISNHVPFLVPEHLRKHYEYPTSMQESYMDSIAYADQSLKRFFSELQNSQFTNALVIVVGDHGFPMGENGNYISVAKAYEENFRTSCLFWWPGKLVPQVIYGIRSQVDIAPSILDLLEIPVQTEFAGRSMFYLKQNFPALVVQPYDGGYLCAIHESGIYRYHVDTRTTDYLSFNPVRKLKIDPPTEDFCRPYLQYLARQIVNLETEKR